MMEGLRVGLRLGVRLSAMSLAALAIGSCGDSTASDGTSSADGSAGTQGSASSEGTPTGDPTVGADSTASGDPTETMGSDCDPVGPWPDTVDAPYLVSRTATGQPQHGGGAPGLSADGRFVVYHSSSDPSGMPTELLFDVFVYDAACDTTVRVPFEHPEDPITEVVFPVISDDGSTVAFVSRDSNFDTQIFVYELATDTLELASLDEAGTPVLGSHDAPSLSADGRFVAFHTGDALVADDDNAEQDVYVRDRQAGTIERVSLTEAGEQATGASNWAVISADGRHVAFESWAALIPGTTLAPQVYLVDRQRGTIELVSGDPAAPSNGVAQRPSISGDGRFVAWHSSASDLVPDDGNGLDDVFVRDRQSGAIERVSLDGDGAELALPTAFGRVSDDGNVVLMTMGYFSVGGDDNVELWAKNRSTGVLTLVAKAPTGDVADADVVNPQLSADGRWAAFETAATNLLSPPKPGGTYDAYAAAIP